MGGHDMHRYERRVAGDGGADAAVKSAARALDVMEFVVQSPEPPSFAAIAAALQVPKSSLSNLLATLVDRNYLIQPDSRGGYLPGGAIERLNAAFWRSAGTAERIELALSTIRKSLGETAGYWERRGDAAEVIATQPGERALVYLLKIGVRAPLHRVSTGKILLAALEDGEIEAYAARADFTQETETGIGSRAALLREVADIRATGIARSRGELVEDVVGIATALRIDGQVIGAVCAALPASRYDDARDADIVATLKGAAARFDGWAGAEETRQ